MSRTVCSGRDPTGSGMRAADGGGSGVLIGGGPASAAGGATCGGSDAGSWLGAWRATSAAARPRKAGTASSTRGRGAVAGAALGSAMTEHAAANSARARPRSGVSAMVSSAGRARRRRHRLWCSCAHRRNVSPRRSTPRTVGPWIEPDAQGKAGRGAVRRVPGVQQANFRGHQHPPLIILAAGGERIDRDVLGAQRLEVEAHPLAELVVEVRVPGPVGQSQCLCPPEDA